MTAKGLINRVVDAITKQYRDLFDYSAAMNDEVLELDFKLNTARETEYIRALGKTVIFTDMADLTPRQIVETYSARSQIETDIRWLKNRMLILLMPEHVWKDVKIGARLFMCCGALGRYYSDGISESILIETAGTEGDSMHREM